MGRAALQTITPFLWFNDRAAEAVAFYQSIFPDTEVLDTKRGGPGPEAVSSITVRLLNQTFIAFNGGPRFRFTPAVSLFVRCDTQAEVDRAWDSLVEGGSPARCGWLTDRYGVSWQVVPSALGTMLSDPDRQKSSRVMEAMLGMVRLDLAALTKAYDGS